jgi:methylmalonyl-CoA/ethylmalonyl-CoA epimerase
MLREIGDVIQVAYVVDDLNEAIRQWSALGAGPFFVIRRIQYVEQTYRDVPSDAEVSAAFGYLGNIQIELLRPLDRSPSSFNDFREQHGSGVQHLGILSRNLAEDSQKLKARGYSEIQRMVSTTGVETVLFEVSNIEGTVIELIDATPAVLEGFAQMKAASVGWDATHTSIIEIQ